MKTTKIIYYVLPLFLLFLILTSTLLNTNFFVNENYTFLVWFIIMFAAFASGRFMSHAFSRYSGAKTIIIVTAIATIFNIGVVATFSEKFSVHSTLIGNLVLYGLRATVLGFSAFFGLIFTEDDEIIEETELNEDSHEVSKGESDLVIREAKLKAQKIIFEAQKKAKKIQENKKKIEVELRELIHTEREVIRNYENEDTSINSDVE